jgi:CheY-like chemotaxis protein/anti-sigma regulatory factor (Ser/Thr protein kinase)
MPTRLWLHSDRDLLRSILQNLLVNALRYTPQGRVVMLARRRGDTVRLEVRDSGVGIADDQLPQAFREFGRLAEGQVLAEGTGLGLSIVARIAAALGHKVEVASRKGVGSVFAVIAPASAPVPVRVAPTPVQADLAGLAVLCVDDDPDILLAVGALIERWGAVVTRCANLAEVPAGGHWDAAVADYQLPDGNGLDLLRDLAGRCPLRILVTATPVETGHRTCLPRASACWPSYAAAGIAGAAGAAGPLPSGGVNRPAAHSITRVQSRASASSCARVCTPVCGRCR